MGFIHPNYASFTRMGILVMPYIASRPERTRRNHSPLYFVQQPFIYIFHLTENYGCHDDMVTDIHRESQVRNGVLVYRIVQNTEVTHTQQ